MNFNILYHWDRAEHGRDAAGAPAKIPDTIQCAADGFAGGYSGNQQQNAFIRNHGLKILAEKHLPVCIVFWRNYEQAASLIDGAHARFGQLTG